MNGKSSLCQIKNYLNKIVALSEEFVCPVYFLYNKLFLTNLVKLDLNINNIYDY
jgi:hypothetical protein